MLQGVPGVQGCSGVSAIACRLFCAPAHPETDNMSSMASSTAEAEAEPIEPPAVDWAPSAEKWDALADEQRAALELRLRERLSFLDALGAISGGAAGDDDGKAKGSKGARDKKGGAGKDAAEAASAEAQQREAQEQILKLKAQQDAEMAQTMAKIKDEQTVFDEGRARRPNLPPTVSGGGARRPHRFPPLSRRRRGKARTLAGSSAREARRGRSRRAAARAADMLRSNLGLPAPL